MSEETPKLPKDLLPNDPIMRFLLGDSWPWRVIRPHGGQAMIVAAAICFGFAVWMAVERIWYAVIFELFLGGMIVWAIFTSRRNEREREAYFADLRRQIDQLEDGDV